MKLDLLTNATVVDDAIRFVSSKSKDNLKPSTEGDKEESKEHDYDEIISTRRRARRGIWRNNHERGFLATNKILHKDHLFSDRDGRRRVRRGHNYRNVRKPRMSFKP